ncbi:YncE family protein [Kitasatospora sp. NPDC054939]
MIDPVAGELVGTVRVPGRRPGRMVAHPDGSRLYIPVESGYGGFVVLDPLTLAVTARYDGGDRPQDIALSTDGQHLYVAFAEGEGRVLQPATLKETGRFPAGGGRVSTAADGTLCVLEDPMTCVLLRPGTDPKERREIRLPHTTGNVVAGAPTAWRPPHPPPVRSYPARFKRGGFAYWYRSGYFMPGNYHQAGAGVPIPAAPDVVKGRYCRDRSGTPWNPVIWPVGSYKHFYKVPEWSHGSDETYVDEDDIEST